MGRDRELQFPTGGVVAVDAGARCAGSAPLAVERRSNDSGCGHGGDAWSAHGDGDRVRLHRAVSRDEEAQLEGRANHTGVRRRVRQDSKVCASESAQHGHGRWGRWRSGCGWCSGCLPSASSSCWRSDGAATSRWSFGTASGWCLAGAPGRWLLPRGFAGWCLRRGTGAEGLCGNGHCARGLRGGAITGLARSWRCHQPRRRG